MLEVTVTIVAPTLAEVEDAVLRAVDEMWKQARDGKGDTGEDGAVYQFTVTGEAEEEEAREEATRELYQGIADDPWKGD